MTAAFFALHADLPREAPGDAESLAWALDLARTPERARILDAGCGPGADLALMRAKRPAARLEGLDLHAPFIDRIRQEQPQVTAHVGDMRVLDGVYDLIWSAGAAYGPGVSAALGAWRGHLAPGGVVAFSDCLWRTPRPAPAARAFWQHDYPGMMDLPGHIARIEDAGYRILGARWLGVAAWAAYYEPLARRVAALRPGADAEMTQVLDDTLAEIALWRAHGGDYGYYLSVVQPT